MRFKYHSHVFLALVLAIILQIAATETPPAELVSARIFIFADGEETYFESAGVTPEALFAEVGLEIGQEDMIYANGLPVNPAEDLSGMDPIVLQAKRAAVVQINGEAFLTHASHVSGALWEAGIETRQADFVFPGLSNDVINGLEISHRPGRVVTVLVGEQTLTIRTAAQTVGEALQDAGVALQGLDYSMPGPGEPVPAEGVLQAVRVDEEIILEQVSLPFDSLTQPVADLELDTTQVVQVGQFGLKASSIRVRYEDGLEVSRVTEAEWTAVQPVPRILGYGTKIVVRTMNTPDGPIEYWRAVPVFATSYSPCRLGIDACGNTTASGLPLAKGMVGVIRSWYNVMVFSQVYVPGYGVGTIADIGGGVAGRNWIDLGYSDDDWVSWAANTTVYFLTPVPPLDQILWILP